MSEPVSPLTTTTSVGSTVIISVVQDAQPQIEGENQPLPPQSAPSGEKKRPRLDLTVGLGERKRGRSVFGMVLGTLNKAKLEDKERNASEAVSRHCISSFPALCNLC
jgi:hypothetical protein